MSLDGDKTVEEPKPNSNEATSNSNGSAREGEEVEALPPALERTEDDVAPAPATTERAQESNTSDNSWEMVQVENELHNTIDNAAAESMSETEEIDKDLVMKIRRMLWADDAPSDDRIRWYRQGFLFCETPCFGLQQGDGGPCGVLATVQAEILRCMLFGSRADNEVDADQVSGKSKEDESELPTPSESELQIYLGEAFLTILRRARLNSSQPIMIVSSRSNPCSLEETPLTDAANSDTPTNLSIFEVAKFEDADDEARAFLASILPQFTTPSGVVLFLMSVLMTRGLDAIREDMDDSTTPLIGQFGHCSQELMNLVLCGYASSNVFDGTVPMGDSGLTLRGITSRNPIGYLSHLESLRYCQVGSYFKTPNDPIWVVGSTSHFTVLFSQHRDANSESNSEVLFTTVSRAFRTFDPDENGFIPKESLEAVLKMLAQSVNSLDASVLEENSVSALSASIETAGANIILWDDLWRSVSRLLTGASLESVLQSHNQSSSSSNTPTVEANAESSTANQRPRTESEEMEAAIAASLGHTAPEPVAPAPVMAPSTPVAAPTDETSEEDQLAMAIAASLGHTPQSIEPATPATPVKNEAASQRPRTDSEELAAAIAASLEPAAASAAAAAATNTKDGEDGTVTAQPESSVPMSRSDSMLADENGEKITLYHYNGMVRVSSGGAPRLVKFTITKRGDQEMVGVAVPLGASGGTGSMGLCSDFAVEDVIRTRWPGARIDWLGERPPSID